MALSTTFNRLKREIGIKKCVIIDGNVGDVYLNEKKQIVDLKQYLMDMLKSMNYDDVLYWDRVDGVDGDVSRLTVTDEVEVEGEAYSFDDDEDNNYQDDNEEAEDEDNTWTKESARKQFLDDYDNDNTYLDQERASRRKHKGKRFK